MSAIKDVDRGWNRIKRLARKKGHVEVGFLGSKGSARHSGSRQSVAQIASYHEWGTPNIPRRSMLDDWMVKRAKEIVAATNKIGAEVLDGRATMTQALGRLGVFAQGDIQARIARGIPPPLAASTIRAKGSSKQLIDTGQMRGSVSHRVKSR